ncbi:macro domain-containing protein [Legionella israelensis]|uniref:macro domain-containing protein n=1 Tax=Legionella israelensis TaxID=454 RepID=UPI00117CB086|nr:macro domain-containing protein [Legionella israelensis]QDP71996.1 macro domain-containing protein [Legionella israelensis]
MEIQKGACRIELVKDDITKQSDMGAIVNAANADLTMGGGVAGAIHRSAGSELEKECQNLAPIKPGEAVITKAYNLPNQYVIHCLGPVYGVDKPEKELLAHCYLNAIELAESKKIKSLAFPSISTGAFGYPVEEAAKVALNALSKKVNELKHVKSIRFVLFSENDLQVYRKALKEVFNE